MQPDAKPKPARLDETGRGVGREFIEFELDRATMLEVETLATKSGCTPFQMSVTLLQEGLSRIAAG